MQDSVETLRSALRTRDYREAELAFARWALTADPEAVTALLSELDSAEVRRLGHAIYVALAAGVLDAGAFEPVTRALGARAGIAQLFGDVRAIWQPDVAFEVGRLRQRVEELSRLSG